MIAVRRPRLRAPKLDRAIVLGDKALLLWWLQGLFGGFGLGLIFALFVAHLSPRWWIAVGVDFALLIMLFFWAEGAVADSRAATRARRRSG